MEKAPGSGGPAAGKAEGVKSGEQLLKEVKEQVHNEQAPVDQVAPAEATIRSTDADGTAGKSETTAKSQAEATENLAKEQQKLDKKADASAKEVNADTKRQADESTETQRRIAEPAKDRPAKGR